MDFWCFLMCFLRGFFCFSRLRCYKHFLAFFSPSPKAGNQSPKIEDQSSLGVLGKISRYRSISENTYSIFSYIFQGFGGSRFNPILISTGLISSSQEFPHSFPDHPDVSSVYGRFVGGWLVVCWLSWSWDQNVRRYPGYNTNSEIRRILSASLQNVLFFKREGHDALKWYWHNILKTLRSPWQHNPWIPTENYGKPHCPWPMKGPSAGEPRADSAPKRPIRSSGADNRCGGKKSAFERRIFVTSMFQYP